MAKEIRTLFFKKIFYLIISHLGVIPYAGKYIY